jgi:DUF4097 and DUF4098 domain-containing protein YvlB
MKTKELDMRTLTLIAATALSLACLAPAARAGTPLDQTRPLDPLGRVEIDNLKGRVEVRAWNRPEVRITGTLGRGVEKFSVEGDRGELRIEVKYPSRNRDTEPTHLVVQVPLQAALEVDTVAADIDVGGVAPRELSLQSVSGDVTANGAPRRATVESVSGDVTLTFNSASVEASTVSGDLSLNGRLDGEAAVERVSGNIRFDSRGERLAKFSAGTVSGDVDARLGLADGGEVRMESVSGDLVVAVPKDLSAEVSGESFSGDLAAPGAHVRREKFGPGASLDARYGAGKGTIRFETFSGDAELRWQ